MFEAGALSKHIEKDLVCPICFGMKTTDLKGPLSYFQCSTFDKKEMMRILSMINNNLETGALGADVLNAAFEKWWPDLNEKVEKSLMDISTNNQRQTRTDRDLLEEILNLMRDSVLNDCSKSISSNEIHNLVEAFYDLVDHIVDLEISNEIKSFLEIICIYIQKIIDFSIQNDGRFTKRLETAMELLNQAKIH